MVCAGGRLGFGPNPKLRITVLRSPLICPPLPGRLVFSGTWMIEWIGNCLDRDAQDRTSWAVCAGTQFPLTMVCPMAWKVRRPNSDMLGHLQPSLCVLFYVV